MDTGFEKYTDEELETKLMEIKNMEFNIAREKQHREEEQKKELHKDVIGKYFVFKDDDRYIAKIWDIQNEAYVAKVIFHSSNTGSTLLPSNSEIRFHICPKQRIEDLSDWKEVSQEEMKREIENWKKNVNVYVEL